MEKDLTKLFSILEKPQPSANLVQKIILNIEKQKKLARLKNRLLLYSLSTGASAIASVATFIIFKNRLADSGFINFFSLLFSDFAIIITSWQIFLMSLVEAIPLSSLIFMLSSLLLFFVSLKYLSQNIHKLKLI